MLHLTIIHKTTKKEHFDDIDMVYVEKGFLFFVVWRPRDDYESLRRRKLTRLKSFTVSRI